MQPDGPKQLRLRHTRRSEYKRRKKLCALRQRRPSAHVLRSRIFCRSGIQEGSVSMIATKASSVSLNCCVRSRVENVSRMVQHNKTQANDRVMHLPHYRPREICVFSPTRINVGTVIFDNSRSFDPHVRPFPATRLPRPRALFATSCRPEQTSRSPDACSRSRA